MLIVTEPTQTQKQIAPGIVEVNSSTLVIGPTGGGKSTLLATAYEYVYEEYDRVSLHYNSDPGGFPDKLRALIAHGIVRVFRMQSRGNDFSFETAQLSARGYWPAKIEPKSGMVPRGVRMIPPVVTTYVETCGHCGQEAGRTVASTLLYRGVCPHCEKPRSPQTARVAQVQTVSRGFENIGTRGYDGLTSISDWYLQDMSHRVELGGEEGSVGGKISSGDLHWRQNNRAQVGFAQSRIHELIVASLEIPGMILMPLWTAISDDTTDEGGLPVVGPKLAGSAKTDIAPQWFGNVFEAVLDEDAQGRKVRRVYLSEYIDSRRRRHLLKHRGDPRYVPEVVSDTPYDAQGQPPAEIFTNFHLGHVFRLLDESLAKTMLDVSARYPDAPGLDAVPSEYGFDVSTDVPVPSVQTAPTGRPQARSSRPAARGKVTPVTPAAVAPQAQTAPAASVQPAAGAQAPEAGGANEPATLAPAPTSPGPVEAPTPQVVQSATVPPATGEPARPSPGAWAPPPGRSLAAPRAPAAAPRARPTARPVPKS